MEAGRLGLSENNPEKQFSNQINIGNYIMGGSLILFLFYQFI